MRTTIDIDPTLLAEAERLTGEKSPSRAVNKALAEYLRRAKIQKLRRLIKETELADTWEKDEELELEETRQQLQ